MKASFSAADSLVSVHDAIDILVEQAVEDAEYLQSSMSLEHPNYKQASMHEKKGLRSNGSTRGKQKKFWSSRVRSALAEGHLTLLDDIGQEASAFNTLLGFVKVDQLTQWLADSGLAVDGVFAGGIRVMPRSSSPYDSASSSLLGMKRNALISKYERLWPRIKNDFVEGGRNGLREAAQVRHGFYDEKKALSWAKKNQRFGVQHSTRSGEVGRTALTGGGNLQAQLG